MHRWVGGLCTNNGSLSSATAPPSQASSAAPRLGVAARWNDFRGLWVLDDVTCSHQRRQSNISVRRRANATEKVVDYDEQTRVEGDVRWLEHYNSDRRQNSAAGPGENRSSDSEQRALFGQIMAIMISTSSIEQIVSRPRFTISGRRGGRATRPMNQISAITDRLRIIEQ